MSKEGFGAPKGAENVSVDILEFSRNKNIMLVAKEDPDATENSSSFADTISGNENISGLSECEVESQFFGDNDLAPPFDGLSSVFPMRKKKLKTQWRKFIHPLMWRCKWTELKIKHLESQASKYARDISIHDRTKHMALDQITVEQSGSRSLSFRYQTRRKSLMKRRKRKRKEDTTDIALYMSNHNLFSERENKRCDLDGVSMWEDTANSDQNDEFGNEEDSAFPEEDEDDSLLEHILRKIELVHTRVNKMKTQIDSVMINNNTFKFSSSENLSQLVPGGGSPTFSEACCNGDDAGSVGSLYAPFPSISDYDLGDFIMLDGTVSSFEEAITIPDIIESTVGLLSSIDVTQHHPQVGDSSEKIVDNILIHNEGGEIEGSAFNNQSADKTQDAAENSGENEEESNNNNNNAIHPSLEPEIKGVVAVSEETSSLKSCLASEIHFPNKRKRGERKAGSGNWSKQRPGEPET